MSVVILVLFVMSVVILVLFVKSDVISGLFVILSTYTFRWIYYVYSFLITHPAGRQIRRQEYTFTCNAYEYQHLLTNSWPMTLNKELPWKMGWPSLPVLWAIQPERQSSEKALNNSVQHRYTQSAAAKHGSAHASTHCTWTSEYRCKWDTTQWLRSSRGYRGYRITILLGSVSSCNNSKNGALMCTSSVFGAAYFPRGKRSVNVPKQKSLMRQEITHIHTRARARARTRSLSLCEGGRERGGGGMSCSPLASVYSRKLVNTIQHDQPEIQ